MRGKEALHQPGGIVLFYSVLAKRVCMLYPNKDKGEETCSASLLGSS
jgi:hypothetical protein